MDDSIFGQQFLCECHDKEEKQGKRRGKEGKIYVKKNMKGKAV